MKKRLIILTIILILISVLSCKNVLAENEEIKIGLFFDMQENAVKKDYHQFSVSSKEGFLIKKYVDDEIIACFDFKNKLMNVHKITFIKVKGHADNEFNNRCDQLATSAYLNHKE